MQLCPHWWPIAVLVFVLSIATSRWWYLFASATLSTYVESNVSLLLSTLRYSIRFWVSLYFAATLLIMMNNGCLCFSLSHEIINLSLPLQNFYAVFHLAWLYTFAFIFHFLFLDDTGFLAVQFFVLSSSLLVSTKKKSVHSREAFYVFSVFFLVANMSFVIRISRVILYLGALIVLDSKPSQYIHQLIAVNGYSVWILFHMHTFSLMPGFPRLNELFRNFPSHDCSEYNFQKWKLFVLALALLWILHCLIEN